MTMRTRRAFLKRLGCGTGGLALAPFLQHMRLLADGGVDALPKRFVFVIRGNGLRPYGVQPQGLGKYFERGDRSQVTEFTEHALKDHALHETMKSLEPFRAKLNIIQGLSSKVCKGPHGGHFGVLGSYTSGDHAPPRKETLDTTLMKHFPGIFPRLAFHIGTRRNEPFRYLDISAIGKNTRTPAYVNPTLAYKDIFGTIMTGKQAAIEAQADRNVMDFLVDDVKKAQKRLTAEEREKLDHYLHGFEALRDRKARLTSMADTLKKAAPEFTDKYRSDVETHRLEAHFDMATAALITGLTNVITIRADELDVDYTGLPLGDERNNLHEIGHRTDIEGGNDRYDSDWKKGRAMRAKIRRFQVDLIAGMAKKLEAVPEADGTMLDNTVILFLSDAGDSHHTGYTNHPVVMLGGLGGKLRTGRYLHYPVYGKPGHRTLRMLFHSVLHASGKPTDDYHDKDPALDASIVQTGALPELMA